MNFSEANVPVDKINADIIALTFFEDERPLRGDSGLIDWRMNGRLSRLLSDEIVIGREGESIIISTDGRIASQRLLLFGLGNSSLFEPKRFQELLTLFVSKVSGLHLRKIALALPGISLFSVETAADAVKSEIEKAVMPPDTEIIILR